MSQFPIDQRPPRSRAEPAWDAGPVASRLRRWHRAPLLGVLGVVVALVAVATLVTGMPGTDDSRDTGVQSPPPCAGPGTPELVAVPEFGFRMPRCFRTADDAVARSETESRNTTARAVITPVEVSDAEADRVGALVVVSAGTLDFDASTVTDDALEVQLWRDVDRLGIAAVSPVRRTVDGARGWRFTLVQPSNESLIWVFVKRTARIQVVCRWSDPTLRARIAAGCDEVVNSLTVT
jgi:hypothetical protein